MASYVSAKEAASQFRDHHRWGAPNPTFPNHIVPLVEPPGVGYYVPTPDYSSTDAIDTASGSRSESPTDVSSLEPDGLQLTPFVLEPHRAACVLCLEDFDEADGSRGVAEWIHKETTDNSTKRLLRRLPCKHIFHNACLMGYVAARSRQSRQSLSPHTELLRMEPSHFKCPACRRLVDIPAPKVMKAADVLMFNPTLPILGKFLPRSPSQDDPRVVLGGHLTLLSSMTSSPVPIPFAPATPAVPAEVQGSSIRERTVEYSKELIRNNDHIWTCHILVIATNNDIYDGPHITGRMFSAGHGKKQYAKDSAAALVLSELRLHRNGPDRILGPSTILQERLRENASQSQTTPGRLSPSFPSVGPPQL
ncbi:hypothetical protein FRB97_001213 [Tulasnella sp. 331]|nr:hypothetical protein FRB97_001213 [Tulasnella sp. 331]